MRRSFRKTYSHYESIWGKTYTAHHHTKGPHWKLGPEFRVLEFPPQGGEDMWTYATVGTSVRPEAGYTHGLELNLHSPDAQAAHVELLTAIAHYHLTGEPVGLNHTVFFGRPWYPGSSCSYGLLSLPYLYGPKLEWLGEPYDDSSTRFLWLIPITGAERNYVIEQGRAEELEQLFEQNSLNYLDPNRPSVV
jgi:Suppressor of fused protein (SUFU)